MGTFGEEQKRHDLERKAKEYGMNPNKYGQGFMAQSRLENDIREERYRRENSRKPLFGESKKAGKTGTIGFIVLMILFGVYFGQKYLKQDSRLGNPNHGFGTNKASSMNFLLNSLDDKEVTDWAEALEEFTTKGTKVEAQIYRDLADSTDIAIPYDQQELFMNSFGVDIYGNQLMTRSHVREVKRKYEIK